jgi:hypothetical protein
VPEGIIKDSCQSVYLDMKTDHQSPFIKKYVATVFNINALESY